MKAFAVAMRGLSAGPTIAVFCLVLLAATRAVGADYYVANDGSDANDGTSLAVPWRTLGHAAAIMKAGDTCFIRGGVYRETLKPMASGAKGAPIVFTAYRGESVTISGADPLSGWTLQSGHIYRAPMDWDLGMGNNQVFVDGRMVL